MNCTNKQQETAECEKRGCEGCFYDEKTADEMFEELGYEILFEDNDYIQYEFEGHYMDNEIKIDKKGKTILKEYSSGDSQEISIQELTAIYKKVQELGWKG